MPLSSHRFYKRVMEAGMTDLRKRFGRLVAAHRRRNGFTQIALAEKVDLSSDMIAKIEGGVSGASFKAIERIAGALRVDPAELFTTEALSSSARRQVFTELTSRLAVLSDDELLWLGDIFQAALAGKRRS